MDEQKKTLTIGTPLCGLIFAIAGAVLALLLIFLGFWKTLLVAVLAGVGYFLGAVANKPEAMKQLLNKLFPPKGE